MADTGLRERHAARTRAAIVTAAHELFADKGFQAATIDDIAARADVAPRTFFRYFPTKEAVLFADAVEHRRRLAAALGARPSDEHPLLALTAVLGDLADEFSAQGEHLQLLQQIAGANPGVIAYERMMFEADMAETLAGFVAERLGVLSTVDPRPQVWAALVMGTFRIAWRLWLDNGQQGDLRAATAASLSAAVEAAEVLSAPVH